MKRLFLLAVGLFIATAMMAQTDATKSGDDEFQTLFKGKKPVKIGWFVAGEPGYTQFEGRSVWLGGISGGMVINHNFSIGLSGRMWYDPHDYTEFSDTSLAYFVGGYGGVLLEYTLLPKSLVHVTFPVMVGGGGAAYIEDWDYDKYKNENYNHDLKVYDNDFFFVIEPGVRAEVSLLPFMRLNAGVSYRFTSGLELLETPSDKLNSFNINMGIKFGKF
jgi:hypothetical protein